MRSVLAGPPAEVAPMTIVPKPLLTLTTPPSTTLSVPAPYSPT
jgi:hypothetical protein